MSVARHSLWRWILMHRYTIKSCRTLRKLRVVKQIVIGLESLGLEDDVIFKACPAQTERVIGYRGKRLRVVRVEWTRTRAALLGS